MDVNWDQLVEEWDGYTWDHPIECQLPVVVGNYIAGLGYYGKPILPEHAQMLREGKQYKGKHPYTVSAHLVDGPLHKGFDRLEDALDYVNARVQYPRSPTCFGTDYGTYYCHGFSYDYHTHVSR